MYVLRISPYMITGYHEAAAVYEVRIQSLEQEIAAAVRQKEESEAAAAATHKEETDRLQAKIDSQVEELASLQSAHLAASTENTSLATTVESLTVRIAQRDAEAAHHAQELDRFRDQIDAACAEVIGTGTTVFITFARIIF